MLTGTASTANLNCVDLSVGEGLALLARLAMIADRQNFYVQALQKDEEAQEGFFILVGQKLESGTPGDRSA